MKKRMTLVVLVLVCALALSACGCKHETWNEANCETPKTCAECGETEGAPLGHSWQAATCETPKTCEVCGKTEGEAPGHNWADADCENPKTCAGCRLTEGDALGHAWVDATTDAPKTCETCAKTEGERIITDERFTTAATADIQGKWMHTVEVDGEMMGDPEFDGTLSISLVLELKNNGEMSTSVVLGDMTAFRNYMLKAMYENFAAEGMDKAAADAAILESTGMTMEEYIDYALNMINFNELLGSINVGGVYYVEGDQLYSGMTWKSTMEGSTFILEDDTLTLMSTEDGILVPTVFTRVQEAD